MRPVFAAAAALVAGLAVGCPAADEKSTAGPEHRVTQAEQRDLAKAETKAAAQALRDYAYAQKTEFVDKMKQELVDIQAELDGLTAKIERSSGAAKAEAKKKLEVVREKLTQAKQRLDRAESATESDWDDIKRGFRASYGDLKVSFNETRQWLSDKIAP